VRIVVAMSGGVDSAVAAALLARQGHEVIGVTLQLADLSRHGLGVSRCCAPADVEVARQVAWKLGLPHYVLDMEATFARDVLHPFLASYLEGETPSPCVRCNSRVKLGELVQAARQMGAEALATGHYARRDEESGGVALRRGADRARDQSYFLFELSPAQLSWARFPLGELTKEEVRRLAAELGLPNAARRDSQDVCFVPPGGSYLQVLEKLAPERLAGEGEIVDAGGRVLGRHGGAHRFTVGQRRGLGVVSRRRLYVLDVNASSNRVTVGTEEEARTHRFRVRDLHWLTPPGDGVLRTLVQIRSRHVPVRCMVELDGDRGARVETEEVVTAPAPGQAAVFYDADRVLGGGWITSSGRPG
jgi:tRNA-specific 2-thiouridylase